MDQANYKIDMFKHLVFENMNMECYDSEWDEKRVFFWIYESGPSTIRMKVFNWSKIEEILHYGVE